MAEDQMVLPTAVSELMRCPDQQGFLTLLWHCECPPEPIPPGSIGWPAKRPPLPPFGIEYAVCCPSAQAVVCDCDPPESSYGAVAESLAAPAPAAFRAVVIEAASASATPATTSLLAFDRFTRTETLLNDLEHTDTGQGWFVPFDRWSVRGGQAIPLPTASEGALVLALVDAGVKDGWVQVVLASGPNANISSRLIFRASDSQNYLYIERRSRAGAPHEDGFFLERLQDGVAYPIAACHLPFTEGADVVSVRLRGPQIDVSVNGIAILSASEKFQLNCTLHGIAGTAGALFTDFTVRGANGGLAVSDRFRRSRPTLGVASSGHAWHTDAGVPWRIQEGRCEIVQSSVDPAFAVLDAGTADCSVAVRTLSIGSAASRLVLRYTDPDNYLYIQAGRFSVHFGMRREGEDIPLTGPMAWSPEGRLIRAALRGDELTLYLNERAAAVVRTDFNNQATQHGFGVGPTPGVASLHAFADFSVEPGNPGGALH